MAVVTANVQTTESPVLVTSPPLAFALTVLYFPTGKRLGFTIDEGKFHNVSLGQGQEMVAEMALEKASRGGHWVILQVSIMFPWTTLGVNPQAWQCPGAWVPYHNTVASGALAFLWEFTKPLKVMRDSINKDGFHLWKKHPQLACFIY